VKKYANISDMTLREHRMFKITKSKSKLETQRPSSAVDLKNILIWFDLGSQAESNALIISYLLTHASDSSVQGSD